MIRAYRHAAQYPDATFQATTSADKLTVAGQCLQHGLRSVQGTVIDKLQNQFHAAVAYGGGDAAIQFPPCHIPAPPRPRRRTQRLKAKAAFMATRPWRREFTEVVIGQSNEKRVCRASIIGNNARPAAAIQAKTLIRTHMNHTLPAPKRA